MIRSSGVRISVSPNRRSAGRRRYRCRLASAAQSSISMPAPDVGRLAEILFDRADELVRAGRAGGAQPCILYIRTSARTWPHLTWGRPMPPSDAPYDPQTAVALAQRLYAEVKASGERNGW